MNRTSSSVAPAWSAPPALVLGWQALVVRERRLALFGAALFALLVPMAVAAVVDDRTLRGADVWIKPIKFALSVGVLSWTTAWFVGHLPATRRTGGAIDRIVALLIGAGSFEFAYIAIQAALGQGSHYNVDDPFHATMYTLMGLGALILTATQPMLAWQLWRHPDPAIPVVQRHAVVTGLVLTFVLGAGIGPLLANLQPPSGGATVPLFGWSRAGGDLRPAHFVGIHAGQILPVVGFVVARLPRGRAIAWIATLAYVAVFAVLVAWGLPAPTHANDSGPRLANRSDLRLHSRASSPYSPSMRSTASFHFYFDFPRDGAGTRR